MGVTGGVVGGVVGVTGGVTCWLAGTTDAGAVGAGGRSAGGAGTIDGDPGSRMRLSDAAITAGGTTGEGLAIGAVDDDLGGFGLGKVANLTVARTGGGLGKSCVTTGAGCPGAQSNAPWINIAIGTICQKFTTSPGLVGGGGSVIFGSMMDPATALNTRKNSNTDCFTIALIENLSQ